ncbi:hypothetical protein [Amycolatopsis suaedae]|uniref:Uncharacterized protein n=1 Tax=Amycolatopsis suaedae TaxID=2510978 RepID=A0A4Q7J6B0_9PSEU|nr:hypothetical protein [Amycolatopsis suaedae]RZQ62292.1 hypothetical protein EWH70_18610 [Amycolatopsis suaedae]
MTTVVEAWARERPDLDLDAIAVAGVDDAMTAPTANVTRLLSALNEKQLGTLDGLLQAPVRALEPQA